uniref:Uncharacterized protein n=1 Tax=Candidatus Methanogaster sp. ANME-2c ERB4 TaxID=2759911 RepID=A0A7G9YEL2_9EURY|nr:hypothetical protein KCGBEFIM_00021 [Methanosarcinales archaeon ANME-2c ERB4]
MIISAVLDVARGVVRKQGISETIPISIITSVIAPVVSTEVRLTDDVRSCRLRDVPGVGTIIVGVIRVVEVVVVNEVVARTYYMTFEDVDLITNLNVTKYLTY